MKETVKSIIKKTPGFDNLNLLRFRVNYFLKDDETVIRERYKTVFGRELNLENPKTFNEKIQWRILKDRKDIYTQLADKYLVRNYVKEKIGEEYLIKLLGVYEKAEDIDYSRLPNKFVLKCNHDSGSVIICKDKSTFNIKESNKRLNFFLKRNFYYMTREWHYKNIKPLIICEEFLEVNNGELYDYKFHCFDGKIEMIQVANNSHTGNNIYSFDWQLLPFKYLNENHNETIVPQKLEEMKKIVKILSEGFNYVRIDLYEYENKIYFGEITFTPNAGYGKFFPEKWDYFYGEKINVKE